jgi:hypothetical protein
MAFGVQAVKLDPIEPCKNGKITVGKPDFGGPGAVLETSEDTF